MIDKLEGKIAGGWFAFGEQDVVVVFEMPDNASATATAIAFAAGGAFKMIKTTPLVTAEEAVQALRKAAGLAIVRPRRPVSGRALPGAALRRV